MQPQLASSILGGSTLIEEDVRSISSIFAKQIASLAQASGKKVVYLTTGDKDEVYKSSAMYKFNLNSCVEELRNGVHVASPDTLRTVDVVVIDSFSTYLFTKPQEEIVELVTEMQRAVKDGKSFILTYEPRMLPSTIDAYIKSTVDTVISIRTDFTGSKINRLLFVQKIKGMKPYDKLVKFTVESDGVQIDTRELIG